MNQVLRDEYLDAIGVQRWVVRDAGAPPAAGVECGNSVAARAGMDVAGVAVDAATDAAVDALDWPQLEKCVSTCVRCGLQDSRTRTVFGSGNRSAEWIIIGEAPGEDEDRQGEPFVGPAGELLTHMLSAVGLQREEVYICNVLKCRPPENRTPAMHEIRHCSAYLQRQVELVNPRLILALGAIAANSLLGGSEKVGALRGNKHAYGAQNIPLVVTYHPAYLLRSPREKRKAWDDLLLARSVCPGRSNG